MTIFAPTPRTVTLASPLIIDGREVHELTLRPPSIAAPRAAVATRPVEPAVLECPLIHDPRRLCCTKRLRGFML